MARDLATRVAAKASGEVAPAAGGPPKLTDEIRRMEQQFQMAMPHGAEAVQLVRDALSVVSANPKLKEAERSTVLGSLMTCAQLGLRPGVLGHAWILPFYDGRDRCMKAQLVIGYQGLVDLIYRSGQVVSIAARTVHENDEFDLVYGLESDTFVHRPALYGPRGKPTHYYAVARMKGGGYSFTEPVQHAEMEEFRDKFAMAKTREGRIVGPWAENFEAMAHKTVLKRLAKLLPKSTELQRALDADERVRVDLRPEGIEHTEYVHEGEVVGDVTVDHGTGEVVDGQQPAEAPAEGASS